MPRRKSKSDFPAALNETRPLDQVIEQANLTTADKIPSLEEAAKRLGVSGHVEPEPELTLSAPADGLNPIRPTEPAKRRAGSAFTLHSDPVNKFKLEKSGRFVELVFEAEPDDQRIKQLYQNGFYRKAGTSTWASPASSQQIDRAYALANEFSGKTERYGVYGGRGR